MDFDQCFNKEWFTDPQKRLEGMFLDRKSEIYPIFDNTAKLADFIIDFIALANMSYRYGRISRILFGISDDYKITGVIGQSTKKKHMTDIDYNNEQDLEKLFRKRMEYDFRQAIKEHIEPERVEIQMHWGRTKEGAPLVAYLEIGAQLSNKTAYRTKNEIKNTRIKAGQSWKREGESNRQLQGEEYNYWLSHNECPVIPISNWRKYFENLQGGRFAEAMNLLGYIEPKTTRGIPLKNIINEFLRSDKSRVLIIEGPAGMGKTEFMRRMVFNIAETIS